MCIQSLHKSTYKKLAFKKGSKYKLTAKDADFYLVTDELGKDFHFAAPGGADGPFYQFLEYFKPLQLP